MTKILVTGDRNWDDVDTIAGAISSVEFMLNVNKTEMVLIHGAAKGADSQTSELFNSFGAKTVAYPANWREFRRAAGPLRNSKMLNENPDIVLCMAFHNDLETSKGTKDMVTKARKAGIPTFVFSDYEIVNEKR